jgi:hypothetical protein
MKSTKKIFISYSIIQLLSMPDNKLPKNVNWN